MNKKQALSLVLFSMVALAAVTGTFAARDEEKSNCVPKPAGGFSIAAVSQGISFIMSGGMGPLIILVIAFVIGMVVSHLLWGGF